jgi:CubicO group peptidase (beta-lactamase class C family)
MTMMDRRLFLAGSGALAATPAFATQPDRKEAPSQWPNIQTYLDKQTKKYVPGAGAALSKGSDAPAFFVAGVLGKKSKTLITPDTLWRAYSMTKPITGMAAMMLIEDGRMKMDQNIADFFPAFANPRVLVDAKKDLTSRAATRPITIRQVLTHTAGFGYHFSTKGPLGDEYKRLGLTAAIVSKKKLPGVEKDTPYAPDLKTFAERLATLPLLHEPGTIWQYSLSLDLMGSLIEVASGMSFEAFVQKRIFSPLGMTSTFWQVPKAEAGRFTDNHFASPIGRIVIDEGADSVYSDPVPLAFGGAGLVTSMRDYDRFLAMLMGQGAVGGVRIMKPETVKLGMSNLLSADVDMSREFVKGQGYGAGGRVTINAVPGGSTVGTYGWGGAASTTAWVDPVRNIRASGWSQIMVSGPQPFTQGFAKAVYA